MPKDRKFQELAELWEELLETVLLLDNVCKVSETLCHYDFRVHSQTLVLLQSLLRDAERKIFRVHEALIKLFRDLSLATVREREREREIREK